MPSVKPQTNIIIIKSYFQTLKYTVVGFGTLMPLFDAHCHLHCVPEEVKNIIDDAIDSDIAKVAVNATNEDDWDIVQQLACDYPTFVVPSFGVHPWWASAVLPGWLDRLRAILISNPEAGVGEIGLDRSK
jgi:TatD DNase family protein